MNITLTLTVEHWNEVMAALQARPPSSGWPVIHALNAQASAQMPDAPKVTGPMGWCGHVAYVKGPGIPAP